LTDRCDDAAVGHLAFLLSVNRDGDFVRHRANQQVADGLLRREVADQLRQKLRERKPPNLRWGDLPAADPGLPRRHRQTPGARARGRASPRSTVVSKVKAVVREQGGEDSLDVALVGLLLREEFVQTRSGLEDRALD